MEESNTGDVLNTMFNLQYTVVAVTEDLLYKKQLTGGPYVDSLKCNDITN